MALARRAVDVERRFRRLQCGRGLGLRRLRAPARLSRRASRRPGPGHDSSFLINSVTAKDHVWALAFVLGSLF